MHGCARPLLLALAFACLLSGTAAASPLPAGTYDVQIGQGTVDLGAGLLPALTLSSGTSFTVPVADQPVSKPISLTVADVPISGAGLTGTLSVTVASANLTITPADGSAALDASFFSVLTANGIGSCSFGSSNSPITVHLTTANGAPWDAATGGFTMADKTFVMPAPSCSPALLGGLIGGLLGSTTNPGDNLISLVGTALRQADPVVTPVVNPTTSSQPGTGSSGAATTTDTTSAPVTQPARPPVAVKSCVVPKLVGKTLKQAKRALKKAGCTAGKTKKASSKKRRKGRILKQRYKAGKKLPAGAKVPLTVSKGPKNARKHRSR